MPARTPSPGSSRGAPDPSRDAAPDAAAVTRWLRSRGRATGRVEALAGDVSARRYFRVELAAGTAIVATYPPAMRPVCRRFLRTGTLLASVSVPVPAVLDADCAAGMTLQEDAGRRCLHELPESAWDRLEPYFDRAAELARRIGRIDPGRLEREGLLPPLDGEVLRRELEQTRREFLAPHGLLGDAALAAALEELFDEICRRLDEPAARRPCHRDFMARNLLARGDAPGLVVLDHQDLRPGPPLYDLASLLNDTVFPPSEAEERLVSAAVGAGPRTAYHRVAAQRCLKAVGTYAAFARRGDDRHLPLVGPTLERGLRHLHALPEARGIAPRLVATWRGRSE